MSATPARGRWTAFVEPRADGLPNWRVITLPLALLAAIFLGLVAFGLTGTSTGVVYPEISTGADPNLVAGHPEPIRSDEWFVQTTWTISQVQQGLPVRNDSFPGGMDATVQHDLPALDWSTAFRPHLTGFLFLPLAEAMAVKWWLPAFAMVAALYLFAVCLLPRRPVTSLMLAVGFFFAPFFQWWYLSITFYAPAWAFLVMATVVWSLRSERPAERWILAALAAYATVVLGTGIYVPFIVPVVAVALAFAIGAVLMPWPGLPSVGQRLKRLLPLIIGGVVGCAVLVVWLLTRWQTIVGFTSTVYPGQRLQSTGGAGLYDFGGLFSGVLSFMLDRTNGAPFASNPSEASTFLLPGLFLSIALIWLIVERARAKRGIDWLSIALLIIGAVMIAYLFVPGWDAVSHALLLDRTTYGRIRMGFGVLSLVLIVVTGVRLHERGTFAEKRVPNWMPLVSAGTALVVNVLVVWLLSHRVDLGAVLASTPKRTIAIGAAIFVLFVLDVWLFARGYLAAGAAVLLVMSIGSAGWVNPLYHGVLDLRSTKTAAAVEQANSSSPGTWVGLGGTSLPTMVLVESGVSSFNGFQSSPSKSMWSEIDPGSRNEGIWNRLANVSWVAGTGAPAPRNPAPDQIQMTFDSCDAFAQKHVKWVLAQGTVPQSCLRPVESVQQGPTRMTIYRVISQG